MRRNASRFKLVSVRLGLLCCSLVLSVLGCEWLARKIMDPADFLVMDLVSDPILRHRIKEDAIGHDAWGFRNESVPLHADIVAIGDSQTYGWIAGSKYSWPSQLQAITGRTVYNMGLGG